MYIEAEKFENLKLFANKLSWLYYSNVYLIGSSLKTKNFNDVDVIVLMEDDDFERKIGDVDEWHNEITGKKKDKIVTNIWANACYKQWVISCKMTQLKLDFKILPKKYCKLFYPYKRLDNFEKKLDEY